MLQILTGVGEAVLFFCFRKNKILYKKLEKLYDLLYLARSFNGHGL